MICSRSKHQLSLLEKQHREIYNGRLIDRIDDECGGNYKKFLIYACQTRPEYLVGQLKDALGGIGSDKSLVNEIFCLSSTNDIFAIRALYEQSHDRSLSDVLRGELSGEHEKLIINLLLNGRDDSPPNVSAAEQHARDIQRLIENGGTMMGGLDDSAQREVRTLHPPSASYLTLLMPVTPPPLRFVFSDRKDPCLVLPGPVQSNHRYTYCTCIYIHPFPPATLIELLPCFRLLLQPLGKGSFPMKLLSLGLSSLSSVGL